MASRYGSGSTRGRRQTDDTPLSDAPIAKAEEKASTGRVLAGSAFTGIHGAVAGKKGHKLRAVGNEAGGAIAGSLPGYAAAKIGAATGRRGLVAAGNMANISGTFAGGGLGTMRAHRMGHYKAQSVDKADWANITEHQRGARDARRTKRTGASVTSAGAAATGLVLAHAASRKIPAKAVGEGAKKIVHAARHPFKQPMKPQDAPAWLAPHLDPSVSRWQGVKAASKKHPHSAAALATGATAAGGATTWGIGALKERGHDKAISSQRKARVTKALTVVSKTRSFDPEHARQRKMGAASAALGIGGLAAGIKGGKGILATSRSARSMSGVVGPAGGVNGHAADQVRNHRKITALKNSLKHGVSAGGKDLAYTGGGATALGGASAIQHHASSRRGKAWD